MTIDNAEINAELDRIKSNYYRDHFRRFVKYLILLILLNMVLVIAVAYLYVTRPHDPEKFFTSAMITGRVRPLLPLSKSFDPVQLQKNFYQVISTAFNFNFANYQAVFANIKDSFSDSGWRTFNLAMQDIVNKVANEQLFVIPTVGVPTVLNPKGRVISGVITYNLQLPVKLDFKKGIQEPNIAQRVLTLRMVVARSVDLDKPEDAVIISFNIN